MEDLTSGIQAGNYTRRNAIGLTPSLPSPEKRLRVVVLGASGVGKTQIIARFLERPFSLAYLPTVEDFHRTKYTIKGRTYQLDILDTAGHTLSPVMRNLTLLTGDLFLVVYSVHSRGSWETAKNFVASIEAITSDPIQTNNCMERSFRNILHANGGTSFGTDKFTNGIHEKKATKCMFKVPILLVGNKCDLRNAQIQSYDVAGWMRQRTHNSVTNVNHMLVSAKTGENIQEMFDLFFAISRLPMELSLSMHRKVTENEYKRNSFACRDKLGIQRDERPRSAEFSFIQRPRRQSICKNTNHLRVMPGSQSCSNSSSDSDERDSSSSSDAIATICSSQRRPSIDTEVLLAVSKLRAYAPAAIQRKKHENNPVKNLKKRMNTFMHM